MIFAVVTTRTGWTPHEISQLTLAQLGMYLRHWIGTTGDGKSQDQATDLDMFNIMAGIPKKVVSRK